MDLYPDSWSANYIESPDRESFEFVDFPSHSLPGLMAMYLWDACNKGRLFDFKTYKKNVLNHFLKNFVEKTIEDLPFPPHFTKTRVLSRFLETLDVAFDKSELIDSFESVDAEDLESVKELARKNKETGEESFGKFVKFLKRDPFPPILWMEFSRFEQVFVDSMQLMLDRLKLWFKFSPRRLSHVRERSKLAQTMARPYAGLIHHYFDSMVNLLKIYLFMEAWSCEKESELFTEKLWAFDKVEIEAFEEIFFQFHNSINRLQQSILNFKPETIKIDFSEPTEWAFKQLVQMAEV